MRALKLMMSEELRGFGEVSGLSRLELVDAVNEVFPDASLTIRHLTSYAGDHPEYAGNPLALVAFLAMSGRPRLLEWVADLAGYSVVRRVRQDGDPVVELMEATGAAMRSESAVVEVIVAAVADGVVTREEVELARARVREDHAANERCLRVLEMLHERTGVGCRTDRADQSDRGVG
jgi:hypothetical protein